MTTGVFHSVEISSILIDRAKRQRRELEGIPDLAKSIQRNGLINPILIQRDTHELIAGERRLEAHKLLGWTHIIAQFEDEVDPVELQVLELEENIRRQQLPWAEEVAAVERFHTIKLQLDPEWTKVKTAEALGVSPKIVEEKLDVAKAGKTQPKIFEVDKFSSARNIVRRATERKANAIAARLGTEVFVTAEVEKPRFILNQSFHDWAPTYTGPKFTLIHCDFPYGINADSIHQGNQRAEHGDYADSENVYWELLETFARHLDSFCAPTAHLMFWFSMKFYTETVAFLRSRTDFIVDDFPLIWHKADGKGIVPDTQRGPRRVYETALFARRGDRKIVSITDNTVSLPLGERVHMSQKPEGVLKHFFRMLVDDTTAVLDPTCGSGTAIAVAKAMKAERVLGLELNSEFAERAAALVEKV